MKISQKLNLERYTPALIIFLANKMSTGASQIYTELFDISVTEWRILSLLAVEQPITAKRVCEVVGLDKGTVSRSVTSLEKKHYIKIETDPNDRRASMIDLTDEGINIHNKVLKIALEREQKLLEDISEEELETFIRILNLLNNRVVNLNNFFYQKYLK